jgi:hypothetical protein
MKAVIRYKKLKFWDDGLLEYIIRGLLLQEFVVEVNKQLPDKAPDLLIQWHRDNWDFIVNDGVTPNKFHNTTVMMLELGWFNREKFLLIYNKDGIRYKPRKVDKTYTKFFKKISKSSNKVWLILGQMWNDQSLKACENYGKWIEEVTSKLKAWGNYPVVYRPHPKGKDKPENTLDVDLGRAIGVVSWNSSSVLKAMMHRIPACIYDFPEVRDVCQEGLTASWVQQVESGMYQELHINKLNWLASQQVSQGQFRKLDYKSYMI